MKRIKLYTALTIATLAFSGLAWAAESPTPAAPERKAASEPGKLDRHDEEFLRKAAGINLVEIEIGKLAEKNSSDPKIKKFAASIVKDHSEANQKLSRLAASKGYSLPSGVSTWDRHEINLLQKEQGEKFNKEFLSFSVKGHEKAIDLYQKAASRSKDQDIKAFADKMLPHLKEHLAMAKSGSLEMVGEKQKQIQQKQPQQSQQPYLQEKRGY